MTWLVLRLLCVGSEVLEASLLCLLINFLTVDAVCESWLLQANEFILSCANGHANAYGNAKPRPSWLGALSLLRSII